jgi:hypothetical protein
MTTLQVIVDDIPYAMLNVTLIANAYIHGWLD